MNFAKKIDENKGEEGMQTKTTSGVNVNDMDLGATEEEEVNKFKFLGLCRFLLVYFTLDLYLVLM